MFKTLSLAGAAIAMSATALVPVAPAAAQSRHYSGDRYDRGYSQDYRSQDYRSQDYRAQDYRGQSYRSYRARQKCDDGYGGTIVGAIAGGLLGRSVAGRGDHVLGTVLGGAAGALAGRAIDRSDRPGYCRR